MAASLVQIWRHYLRHQKCGHVPAFEHRQTALDVIAIFRHEQVLLRVHSIAIYNTYRTCPVQMNNTHRTCPTKSVPVTSCVGVERISKQRLTSFATNRYSYVRGPGLEVEASSLGFRISGFRFRVQGVGLGGGRRQPLRN